MVRASCLLVLGLLGGTACTAEAAVRVAAVEHAPALAKLGEGIDWSRLLVPASAGDATQAPASEKPVAVEPVAEARTAFGPSELMVLDQSLDLEHRDVASFCKAQIGCFEIALPVEFSPNKSFRGLHAVRVKTEGYAYSTLLAEVPGGVAPLGVSFDVVNPDDPGCPSYVREIGIERVSIENGMLVVVALGTTTTFVDPAPGDSGDSGARQALLPVVSIAKLDGERVHLRHFQSMGGPELGSIVQPSTRFVPWHKLAWKNRVPFAIKADGTMRVGR